MEFAVIETGGKQYKVSAGDVIQVEKLPGSHKLGDVVTFDKVLLIENGTDTKVGSPYIAGATVTASYELTGRAPKLLVMKYKAKSNYLKRNGHRQPFSKVKISGIK